MNQSTIPHTEIGLRLTICSEFLLHEEKPIEELYRSWIRRVGGKLIEFAEFEYWYRRFKNNQFDLGYDTSLDSMEISEIQNTIGPEASGAKKGSIVIMEKEIPVNIVERKMEDSTLNYQFNERDVPEAFQILINDRMNDLVKISLDLNDSFSWMKFDDVHIRFEKKTDNWTLTYNCSETTDSTTIETADPEKSITDHLWFVLKNPKVKLVYLLFKNDESKVENGDSQEIDSEKLNTLFQSMIDSIDHQVQVKLFGFEGYNEDTFLSILKCIKPEKLEAIGFGVSWKEEGNYQKLDEIMKTDQWKNAKRIVSLRVTSLKIEDLFQYESFWLELESITPEVVLSVTEHLSNSTDRKFCTLTSRNQNVDINAIIDSLHAKIDGSVTCNVETQLGKIRVNRLGFKTVKSAKWVFLNRSENGIFIRNY